jgi:hypothetical protein
MSAADDSMSIFPSAPSIRMLPIVASTSMIPRPPMIETSPWTVSLYMDFAATGLDVDKSAIRVFGLDSYSLFVPHEHLDTAAQRLDVDPFCIAHVDDGVGLSLEWAHHHHGSDNQSVHRSILRLRQSVESLSGSCVYRVRSSL